MKVDRALKREIMEMVHNAFSADPLATRKDVCARVMAEMGASRPELMERAQEVSLGHMLESIVGEWVRRTRARIRDGVLAGQDTADAPPPPYEVVSKIRLTIPFGNGEFEDKPALLCTRTEVAAARSYYARQKRAIDKRESYCAALEGAMRDAELGTDATVHDLYAA